MEAEEQGWGKGIEGQGTERRNTTTVDLLGNLKWEQGEGVGEGGGREEGQGRGSEGHLTSPLSSEQLVHEPNALIPLHAQLVHEPSALPPHPSSLRTSLSTERAFSGPGWSLMANSTKTMSTSRVSRRWTHIEKYSEVVAAKGG